MSFVVYDLVFLAVCLLAFGIFIWRKKHNLKRQGILYLYPTQVGVKFIDKFTNKYSKILKILEPVVILSGIILMISMIWMLFSFSYSYISSPILAQALKVPVLTPLIPYLPELFHLNFLPPFYFTYWIIIIALIAVPHEFAHGIYARLNKIKVHSTGFGFLGPFLAAFVEPDEKKMQRSPIKSQMAVLAAGTFSNILIALAGLLLLWAFFAAAFTPAGVIFNSYAVSAVNLTDISSIGGVPIANVSDRVITTNSSLIPLIADNSTYFADPQTLTYSFSNNLSYIVAYDDSPALEANLSGAIILIDNVKISDYSSLNQTIHSHKPDDIVVITTRADNGTITNTTIRFADKGGQPFLGVGIIPLQKRSGIMGWFYNAVSAIKNPSIYYDSKLGDFGTFIYDFFWWGIIISISVALVNMLPVGIFDGGRFFYLMVLALTKRETVAKSAFKTSTWIMLIIVALLMIKWVIAFI
jgi:membrane-associated protease RseP (regulator of RpoE activity)